VTGSPTARRATDDGDDATAGGDGHVERYERLRARALDGDGAGWQLGLALLRRQGVAAWARAWPTQPAAPRPVRPVAAVPASAGGEIVDVLASMALARLAA
jgi:hypothetical protein